MKKISVALVMGSKSDYPIMSEAEACLNEFGIDCQVEVISAHRTAEKMFEFASKAQQRGYQIIIAGAGGAAHLPGMIAAVTYLPVIGVPVISTRLGGLDSLLSIAQMPKGVPVATVAIDGAWNAALLAVQILALHQPDLQTKLKKFRSQQQIKVNKMNQELRKERGSKRGKRKGFTK